MTTNIILCGVGGQGLVLSTKLIADAILNAGYDLKTTDIIGLSQRGGKVWGTIRYGKQVFSPNIARGKGHFMLAMEPLEALRWLDVMSHENGHIFLNTREIYPTSVLLEKEQYPKDCYSRLKDKCELVALNAFEKGKEFGTEKLANTFLVGLLADRTDISKDCWINSINKNVPKKFLEANIKAFEYGFDT
ncbi:indolepyruvate oxidoreductase subunit beta [Natranaerobius trueperi]|uniref:Pyruvate ferredoxin oxidoreductase n=1 Tax=Natranaerobius trueperi TaxID=759412 RepID=A0A226C3I1_9FIRM|nr:indolepyruvate oxidoreductase subunit beta [Natranaerobius trueperi]OWZ84987.1 pyruvate ferredoxin oxidoreductase [Natranaerobius trueperi]